MNIKGRLAILISEAGLLGLNDADVASCNELLKYQEYGLCLDTIVIQLYEYQVSIDSKFYHSVSDALSKIKMNSEEYMYLKELIRL